MSVNIWGIWAQGLAGTRARDERTTLPLAVGASNKNCLFHVALFHVAPRVPPTTAPEGKTPRALHRNSTNVTSGTAHSLRASTPRGQQSGHIIAVHYPVAGQVLR